MQHTPAPPTFPLQSNDVVVFIKTTRWKLFGQFIEPINYFCIILPALIIPKAPVYADNPADPDHACLFFVSTPSGKFSLVVGLYNFFSPVLFLKGLHLLKVRSIHSSIRFSPIV